MHQREIPQILRKMMEVVPGKQAGLAKRLSTKNLKIIQSQISRWLKGSIPETPNYTRIIAVAEELGVISDMRSEDVAATLPVGDQPRTVKLKGYVGAGSRAHFYALTDDDYEEVAAPPGATDRTVAVEIKGSSMGRSFDSWLVFYDDVHSPVNEQLMINQLCVVGLADDRILIKRIEKQRGKGGYQLVSNNPEEPTINDAQIEWAALVTSMRPRR